MTVLPSLPFSPLQFFINQVRLLQSHFSWVSTAPIPWKTYVLAFTWAQWGFETFLLARQYPNYSKPSIPPLLAARQAQRAKSVPASKATASAPKDKDEKPQTQEETFAKSQAYGRDKAQYAFLSGLYQQLITSASLYFDVWPSLWSFAESLIGFVGFGGEYVILHSVAFIFTLLLLSALLTLPLSVYETFGLEASHGFNKTTPGLFVVDTIKAWVLTAVIGGPFLALFLKIFDWMGEAFVPGIMLLLVTFQLLAVFLYPTLIQPLFNKLTPLPETPLRKRIEALATQLKYPLSKLYIIDGSKRSAHSNAYMYGLPWSKHIVVFDTLLEQCTEGEIVAVIAHELGHWYYNHPTTLLLISQFHLFFILSAFAIFQHSPALLLSFGFPDAVARATPTILTFWIFQLLLTPTEAVMGFAMHGVSRKCEYQADEFAAGLEEVGDGKEVHAHVGDGSIGYRLGNALLTLHVKNLSTVWVDWLYSAYHHSHPTLVERLKALEKLEVKGKTAGGRKKDL